MKKFLFVLGSLFFSFSAFAATVEQDFSNTDWNTLAQELTPTTLDSLKAEGFDFQSTDANKNTLFYYVLTKNPDPKLVQKMVEYGADVNQPSASGILPLNVTTSKANELQLQVLMMQTMGIDIQNPKIKGALEDTIFNEMNQMLVITKFLIESGADVNKKSALGTPLMNAATNAWNIDILKALIDSGADLNAIDDEGRTALFYAAIAGNTQIIDALLEAGADENIKDFSGKTYKEVLKSEN